MESVIRLFTLELALAPCPRCHHRTVTALAPNAVYCFACEEWVFTPVLLQVA